MLLSLIFAIWSLSNDIFENTIGIHNLGCGVQLVSVSWPGIAQGEQTEWVWKDPAAIVEPEMLSAQFPFSDGSWPFVIVRTAVLFGWCLMPWSFYCFYN